MVLKLKHPLKHIPKGYRSGPSDAYIPAVQEDTGAPNKRNRKCDSSCVRTCKRSSVEAPSSSIDLVGM